MNMYAYCARLERGSPYSKSKLGWEKGEAMEAFEGNGRQVRSHQAQGQVTSKNWRNFGDSGELQSSIHFKKLGSCPLKSQLLRKYSQTSYLQLCMLVGSECGEIRDRIGTFVCLRYLPTYRRYFGTWVIRAHISSTQGCKAAKASRHNQQRGLYKSPSSPTRLHQHPSRAKSSSRVLCFLSIGIVLRIVTLNPSVAWD